VQLQQRRAYGGLSGAGAQVIGALVAAAIFQMDGIARARARALPARVFAPACGMLAPAWALHGTTVCL